MKLSEAIELIRQMLEDNDEDGGVEFGNRDKEALTLAISALEKQEHRCITCGRTANNGGWYSDGRTRCPIEETYALPKDGHCHLWEKINPSEDNYPEPYQEDESMSRLDEAIASVAYILDCLMVYRNMIKAGECNSCKNKDCKWKPKPGQLVRYNCPHYKAEE